MCDNFKDDMLLGRDFGKKRFGVWLLNTPTFPNCAVWQTRVQASAESEKISKDSADLTSLVLLIFCHIFCHLRMSFLINNQFMPPILPPLGTIRQLAEKQERGYCFLDGVIVHYDKSDLDVPIRCIVFPMKRHMTAIKLAHDRDLAGH